MARPSRQSFFPFTCIDLSCEARILTKANSVATKKAFAAISRKITPVCSGYSIHMVANMGGRLAEGVGRDYAEYRRQPFY